MVGVARVLGVQLPVGFHNLTVVTQHADRPTHNPVDLLKRRRTDIGFQRHDLFRNKRSKNQTLIAGDLQLSQAVAAAVEIFRHASLSSNTFFLGDREKIAGIVVAPEVIRAVEPGGISAEPANDLRAAMRAPVLACVDFCVRSTGDNNAPLTQVRGRVVTRIRNFLFQRQVLPVRTAENSFEFELVEFLIKEKLEWNARAVVFRPDNIETGVHTAFLSHNNWKTQFGPSNMSSSRIQTFKRTSSATARGLKRLHYHQ